MTADELALAKSSVALGYPRGFETVQQIARSVAQLALHDLPDSYFEEFVPRIEAVTLQEVASAAQRYLDPDRMSDRHRRRSGTGQRNAERAGPRARRRR